MLSTGILAAFACMLLFAMGDTLAKNASVGLGSHRTALYIVLSGAVPVTIISVLFPPAGLSATILAIASISGVFLAAGYLLVYISLKTEQASNTWALISISPASLILFGIFALNERVSTLQALCVITILAGVLMITITREMRFNRQLIPAILGNICFALFLVPATYGISAYPNDFTAFFFIPRVIAVAILLAYALLRPQLFRESSGNRRAPKLLGIHPQRVAIISGLLDGAAQVPFMLVVLSGVVAIGGAITATEPMLVIILSYFIYKERLTPLQSLGVAVSVVGAIAVSLV